MWAILEVEARGCGYFADRRPIILFERHIFSRRTKGRFDKEAPDVSNPSPGGYAKGVAEYDRLAKAIALDEKAALESASWGLGQVMGYHAEPLGYGTVAQFVARMAESEDEQLGALSRYIDKNGLAKPLRDNEWKTFARGYNGPAYEKNQYDERLATAHKRLSAHAPPDLAVREGQLRLLFLGFDTHGVDGAIGKTTLTALHGFQAKFGLATSDVFDAATLDALRAQQALLPRGDVPVPVPGPVVITPPVEVTPPPLPRPDPGGVIISRPVPLPVPQPLPIEILGTVDTDAAPLPETLAEQIRQRLSQRLEPEVQEELSRVLVLRGKAARELGPATVETLDLCLIALLADEPKLAFVRNTRSRIDSALSDQLYPLRPLPILRSRSPSTQVVLGLGLMLLVAHAFFSLAQRAMVADEPLFLGLPLRNLLLVGLCGTIGSVVSILTRLGDFEKQRGASRLSMLMMGFFRPMVGMYSALFCFALVKSGLIPLQTSSPSAEPYFSMALCFLVGFSERLAQDLFAKVEGTLVASVGQSAPAPVAQNSPPRV